MITRSDIIWLGLSSGVAGGLVGGLLLGIGLNLVVQGLNVGWLLLMPAAPLSGLTGWLLARQLSVLHRHCCSLVALFLAETQPPAQAELMSA